MRFKCALVKKNFEQYILPDNFEGDLLDNSPFRLIVKNKTFWLDTKSVTFFAKSFYLEGLISDEETFHGRCLIEFINEK
ncbi:hypothetical protein OAL45_00415 [bacterium]|nr:hypothetical protein [bacterium]MDC0317897.1 hypothetical protein [bacterium]